VSTSVSNDIFSGKLLCSVPEAASALSVSQRFVNECISKKRLVSRKIGRRRLVSVASLRAFASHDQVGLAPWSGAKGAGQ
jgi:excisionase family DNA binding protein